MTVIDNTMSTLALGQQIFAASGAAGTANLQAWVSAAPTSVDDTHTNIYGAAYYSYLIATIQGSILSYFLASFGLATQHRFLKYSMPPYSRLGSLSVLRIRSPAVGSAEFPCNAHAWA